MIINFVKDLHDLKTEKEKEYRIICCLPFPDFSRIDVIMLYTKSGLDSFYAGLNHNGQFKKEFELSTNISFLQVEWRLHIPEGLEVKGFERRTEFFKGEGNLTKANMAS